MNDEVNFSTNWNNKLSGTFFTTLRMKDEDRWQPGMIKKIFLQKKFLFCAEIIDIRHIWFDEINNFVAGLDTGYNAEQCQGIIRTMYKNKEVDWQKRKLSLILFRKLKNQHEMKSEEQAQESA